MNPVEIVLSWIHGNSVDDIRRLLSSVFITVDLVLVGVFFSYSWFHFKDTPYKENLAVQASLALGTYFGGRLLIQIWSWMVLSGASGMIELELKWSPGLFFAFVGSVISVMGAAWTVIVFTPPKWRVRGWLLALFMSSLFMGLTWHG